MKTSELRHAFLEFFREKGHTIVPSSSLVPTNDPTLLFTNAGMVQFKDVFLGLEQRPYVRACSSQRCLRAGGKHNDLENVGYTARHHTFFEMLGNFSFGDYFKREAIEFAWEFITKTLKIPKEKLWITVYEKDKEAEEIWLKDIKIDPKRFSRCGAKDNFWSMGDTGPCGPCTEIFYDHGPEIPGGPPGTPEEDGDRYVEIWNLVFMQYDRSQDGALTPLPKPSVDTGSGLERLAAVMQGVHSNYEIDIFKTLIQSIAKIAKTTDLQNKSLRVIADHIRACSFLVLDGIVPSNEGRGYVLRRICRRAIRHGYRLGIQETFFYKLVKPLAEVMGEAYPELNTRKEEIERVLEQEELQFARTLDQGLKILEQDLADVLQKSKSGKGANIIPGPTVFKLYDTYGFPVDLTADIARERGMSIDMDGFEEAMALQRARARGASQFTANYERIDVPHSTDFTGYERLEEATEVVALYQNNKPVHVLKEGAGEGKGKEKEEGEKEGEAIVVLRHTPFYGEAGGQVGDQGVLKWKEGLFEVHNTKKSQDAYLHIGKLKKGNLAIGDPVLAEVDKIKRQQTALNHSATHLLHSAMRIIVGTHVQQKGSLVEPDRLRFDFSHFEPLSKEQIREIEKLVNKEIRKNSSVDTEIIPVEEALQSGAMALFGEKYGKEVRVLKMGGDFSVELCGGTHVQRTGDIGFFKITSEYGISSGVRRLEAVTGARAIEWVEQFEDALGRIASQLKATPDTVEDKLKQALTRQKQMEKDLQALKSQMMSGGAGGGKGADLASEAKEIQGVKVLATKLPVSDIKALREYVDRLKNQWGTAVIVVGAVEDQKITLVAGVSQNTTDKISASELVSHIAEQVGGKGGGRKDMAQGGGNNPNQLDEALSSVYEWVADRLTVR